MQANCSVENKMNSILTPIKRSLLTIVLGFLPLLVSQLFLRGFYIILSRYIAMLGHEALVLQSIQYIFITFGQFTGTATAVSCLILWKRQEYQSRQRSLLLCHILLPATLLTLVLIIAWPWCPAILSLYKVTNIQPELSLQFLHIGLINMLLISLYSTIDGMLVATNQYKTSMSFAALLFLGGFLIGLSAIHYQLHFPLLFIGYSTTLVLLVLLGFAAKRVWIKAQGSQRIHLPEVLRIWKNEIGIAMIRSIAPVIYALQLGTIKSHQSLLVVYQLSLHLAYIFCLPLIMAAQIAVRDASAALSNATDANHHWLRELFILGLLPTSAMLLIAIFIPSELIYWVYHVHVSSFLYAFIPLFYLSCLIGQQGTAVAVPIRAYKQNQIMVRNFFLSELIVNVGGTQLLIFLHIATPLTLGLVSVAFSFTYLILNSISTFRLNRQRYAYV